MHEPKCWRQVATVYFPSQCGPGPEQQMATLRADSLAYLASALEAIGQQARLVRSRDGLQEFVRLEILTCGHPG